jgi:hypothetical protein
MHIHDQRLAAIAASTSYFVNRMTELNLLRDRLKRAQLSARRARLTEIRKKSQDLNKEAASVGRLFYLETSSAESS